jgi:hypothetical protein
MKKLVFILIMTCVSVQQVRAQEQEIEQLVLNIEKLLQFRQILSDMKEGYDLLVQGYTAVRAISEGNFSLHQVFLDGLLDVSPAVKQYKKVALIVGDQLQLVKEYKAAFHRFQSGGHFSGDEMDYIGRVYTQLFERSVNQLSDLTMVLTAGKLRMSDDKRLAVIDRIQEEMNDQLVFLRHFNNRTNILVVQRMKEKNDVNAIRNMHK